MGTCNFRWEDAQLYLTRNQYELARTLYVTALRDALPVARKTVRIAGPAEDSAARSSHPIGGMMFRGAAGLPPTVRPDGALPAQERETDQFDPVIDERKRWENLAPDSYQQFIRPDGLLNEFKMHWQLRALFPLHLIVFRQAASHIPHEANVEQVFSRAGSLSDPSMCTLAPTLWPL